MSNMMSRFVEGRGSEREIDMLLELTKQVEGHTYVLFARCSHPGCAVLIPFRFLLQHLRTRRCCCVADSGTDEALPPRGGAEDRRLPSKER